MDFAIINLEQRKHIEKLPSIDTVIGSTPTHSCGHTSPYYRIPLKPGYTVALGRSPLVDQADESIYIPSAFVSRHVGFIRCTNNVNDETLHILLVESKKTIFYKDDEPVSSNYILRDGDILRIGMFPITLRYNLEKESGCISRFLEHEYYKTTFS